MLSCDTLAVAARATAYKQNVFGKNSDRPTAEAQMLHFYPPRENATEATVKLTDLEIADVEKTYAVIGSQPYWTWGFEMGYNECGLIIGNEAQGSKNAAESDTGILGLDLVRLGLERASTARKAIDVITRLLQKYGQNANASQLTDRRYENAFLLVDKEEIWLLETAGREWVAKRIEDRIGISNCYTIEDVFDLASPDVEKKARENRWLAPDERFNFAKAYTLPAVRQTLAVPRARRLNKLLMKQEQHDAASIKSILRDHFGGEIIESRFGASSGTFFSICMHMREWGESETTASLISRLDGTLGVVSRYALAQPCHSIYVPIYFTGYIPKKLSIGGKIFDERSLWWKLKRLSLLASVDERFERELDEKIADLESAIEFFAGGAEQNAKKLVSAAMNKEACELLDSTMDKAVELTEALCDMEYKRIKSELSQRGGLYGPQADNIRKYCEYAKIELDF